MEDKYREQLRKDKNKFSQQVKRQSEKKPNFIKKQIPPDEIVKNKPPYYPQQPRPQLKGEGLDSPQQIIDLIDKIKGLHSAINELLNRIPSGKEEWEQYEIDKADLYNTLADIISFGSEVEDVF